MSETPHGSHPEAHLSDYWHIIVRRRFIVGLCVAAVLAGAAIVTFRTTPTYRASATVLIERIDPNIMKFQEVLTFDPSYMSYQDYYQTQYRLLESRAVAQKVVRELRLASDPTFLVREDPGLLSRVWTGLTASLRHRRADAGEPKDPEAPYVDAVRAGLRIDPIKNSHLVSVGFISPSPILAAKIANGVSEAYIDFGMETRVGTSENAGDFLTEQIATLRADVADLEHRLQQYGESKEIIPTSGEATTTVTALEDLQRSYTAAQADRAEKEGAWTALRTTPDSAVPQVIQSPLIERLTTETASLERDRAEMAKRFKPEWPALARLTTKLEQSQARLDEETAALAASARKSAEGAYKAAVERERNLQAMLESQKHAAMKLSIDSIEYTNLRSEVMKKRETLNELLKRQSEITLSSHLKDTRQSNTRIIDPATPPHDPWRPNKKVNLALGLLTGLALGAGLAFAIEYLDNTVKSAEEIRRLTGYAAIGIIPEHRAAGPRPMRKGASAPDTNADLVTHVDPRSQLAEAYKELRTATLLASPDQPPRTILVTSCLPQEGKSQTSLNLAIALAQAGKRVLLVDADLRRPRLHKALDVDNERGISTYLSGNSPVEPLIRATDIPGLDVLTSGPIPPNPSELLGSRNFLALVQDFAESGGYDHLIFDSPPLLSVADPIVVATVLDGTILVVQSGQTPRDGLLRGAGKLHHANVKVLGAVLNSVTDGDRSYYYRSRYRYESDGGDRVRGGDRARGGDRRSADEPAAGAGDEPRAGRGTGV